MRDAQFISELFLIILDNKIVGFNQEYLDKKYAEYDDPSVTNPDFSETELINTKEKIKKVLLAINQENESITKYARTFIHFYSLWAFIHVNMKSLGSLSALAKKYQNFMKAEEELAKTENPAEIVEKHKDDMYKNAFEYFQNARGANTDLKQRQRRLDILVKVLLNKR